MGRRREEALVIPGVVSHKLSAFRTGFIVGNKDTWNAFGSGRYIDLKEVIESNTKQTQTCFGNGLPRRLR